MSMYMVSDGPATRCFLAALPAEVRAALIGVPDLEERLLCALDAGRQAWPALKLPDESFLAFLGHRLARRERPVEALDSLHLTDLYLVCAFIHGVPGAGEAMQRDYLSVLPPLLERLGVQGTLIEDVTQILRLLNSQMHLSLQRLLGCARRAPCDLSRGAVSAARSRSSC